MSGIGTYYVAQSAGLARHIYLQLRSWPCLISAIFQSNEFLLSDINGSLCKIKLGTCGILLIVYRCFEPQRQHIKNLDSCSRLQHVTALWPHTCAR